MNGNFVTVGAFLNIFSGITLLIYWFAFAIFLPYRELSTTLSILVKNRNWIWINSLGVIGAIAGLMGQAGIFVIQMTNINGYASVGFYIATLGTTLLIGTMLWETILWPILVKHQESLLDFQGPIYTSKVFFPFFIVAGLVYSLGYILVGIGIIQADVLSPTAGLLLAVGAPTFGLGAMFGKYQVYPRTAGITLMSAGLIWIGFGMFV